MHNCCGQCFGHRYHYMTSFWRFSVPSSSGVDPANTKSEVSLLMSEALSLLSNCAPTADLEKVLLGYFLSFIRDTRCTMLLHSSLSAACRSLANIRHMVCILEATIGAFFNNVSASIASQPSDGATSRGGWEQVVPGVSVPDLSQDEFVQGAWARLLASCDISDH